MLKGLPGSGKSKWAIQFCKENPGWVRINKDILREMMGHYRNGKDEQLILIWRDALIFNCLNNDRNVIVDDTNFHPKHEKRLKEIVAQCDMLFPVQFETKFIDTPLKECIQNDLKRPKSVGEKVIKKMWREFLAPKKEVQNWTIGLPKAVIVDIDGTVALHVARGPYDVEKCNTDKPNRPIVSLVNELSSQGYVILFVSGREETYRGMTLQWFEDSKIHGDFLWMRPTGDHREDSIVKQEIYNEKILGKYNIFCVFDDRNRVVEMWRNLGLTCLQVAEGDF